LRPIFHQLEKRIEAHIFVAFASLLSAPAFACSSSRAGPGIDAPLHAGKVCYHPDAGCSFSNH
jgi:hypothetical protein